MKRTLFYFESPLTKVPVVRRCQSCFYSHFPNKKFCHWSMLRKDISLRIYEKEISQHKANLLRNCINQQNTHGSQRILQKKSFRLRGGAEQERGGASLLVDRAIESARKHGLNLVQGILNKSDGNCAFDAVINNINYRQCYSEKLDLSSEIYRQI